MLAPEWVAPVARRMPEVSEVIPVPFRHGALELAERWRVAASCAARLRQRDRAAEQLEVGPRSIPRRHPARAGYIGELRYGALNSTLSEQQSARCRSITRLAGDAGRAERPHLEVTPLETAETMQRFGIRALTSCSVPEPNTVRRSAGRTSGTLPRASAPVVILGSAKDAPAASGVPGLNLVGKTSLDEAVA